MLWIHLIQASESILAQLDYHPVQQADPYAFVVAHKFKTTLVEHENQCQLDAAKV